jgi:hypothetical protein
MNTFEDLIGRVEDHLATLAGVDLSALSDDELCAATVAVERAGRLLDGARAGAAGAIDERSGRRLGSDSLAQRRGCRNSTHLVERLTTVSQTEAARRVRLGKAVRRRTTLVGDSVPAEHPFVAQALTLGRIGFDSAIAIVRCMDDALRTASDDDVLLAERALVDAAEHSTADETAIQARAWREALDPDGAEPRDERLLRKRAFFLGREKDGLTPFSGALEPVGAALLKAAFAEAERPGSTPRFVSHADRLAGTVVSTGDDGTESLEFLDPRTREQRRYDVFAGLLTAGIRASTHAPVGMRSTASVTAVITLDELRAAVADNEGGAGAAGGSGVGGGVGDGRTGRGGSVHGGVGDGGTGRGIGWLAGIDEPVSAATIRDLVSASGYAPLLLGDNGEVLYLGRRRRLFSPLQLAAMAARDGGCVNCGAPPGASDGHHVVSWKDGGKTDIDNGVLLCRNCHTMIHASGHRLRMIDGRPWILAPPALDPGQTWRRLRNHRMDALLAGRRSPARQR